MSICRSLFVVVSAACVAYYLTRTDDLPAVVGGHCDLRFSRVADIFRSQIENGFEKGAMFSVYYQGKPVVDLWGGYANPTWHQAWKNNTMLVVFSSSKGIGALLAARMVEKGYLDYKKPVSFYWPEFAQNGKESITVEMLLSHQSGLITLDKKIPLTLIKTDPQKVADHLAAQKPEWEPGTKFGYHAISFGLFVDRLIEKADPKKRTFDRIFAEEIAIPFGIDFYMGAPRSEHYRIANFFFQPLTTILHSALLKFNYLFRETMKRMLLPNEYFSKAINVLQGFESINVLNDPENREVPFSSMTGIGTARALAKLYSIVANGGKHSGQTLLSEKIIKKIQTPLVSGTDVVLNIPAKMGPGLLLSLQNPLGDPVFGHAGFGGQFAGGDMKYRVGFAYLTNHLDPYSNADDCRFEPLFSAVYETIRDLEKKKKH